MQFVILTFVYQQRLSIEVFTRSALFDVIDVRLIKEFSFMRQVSGGSSIGSHLDV